MSYLNKPLEKGKLKLRNRLVMPPIATGKAEADGSVGQNLLQYYDEKSRGGYLSLVIIEHAYISKQGQAKVSQISISEDRFVEGFQKIADVIHKNGSKTVMEISHAGSMAEKAVLGFDPVGPSAIKNPSKDGAEIPSALDISEMKMIINDFAKAAIRVKKAGFDGVEIHSAHGYLLSQFLSPLTNRRTDQYGGDIHGRIRFHLEIIEAVRSVVGDEFPILLRFGAADYMEGGLTLEDSVIAAQAFEKAGVDLLDVSGGMCRYTIPGINTPGYFSQLSKEIKEVTSIPVIVTGGITQASEAEDILKKKRADLVGVGRAILKDSNWAKTTIESLK